MDFFEKASAFLNQGDPEIRTWFLIRNSYLPFILSFSYAIIVTKIGPSFMKNRQPFEIRKIMVTFNFFIVTLYSILLILAAYYLPQVSWQEFCYGGVVEKGKVSYTLTSIGWILYLTKYMEFFDTFFFVLRKKYNLITFLHVFHHAVVPLIGWFLFRTEKTASQTVPAIINTVVHVIMYTYYGIAAMGPHMKKYLWWKKYLTQLQIGQFIFLILFVAFYAPLSGCSMVASTYVIDVFFGPLFLYLFYSFYKKSFTPREQKLQ